MTRSDETKPYFPAWQIRQAKETIEETPIIFSKKRAVVRGLRYGLVTGVVALINPVLVAGVAVFITAIEEPGLLKAHRDWKEAKRIVAESSKN